MDKEQEELKFIGFFGIWSKSFKTIYSWRQIFIQLSLTLILPLSFIYFSHIEITYLLTRNRNKILFNDDQTTTTFLSWYLLIQFSYIVFLLVFSLHSTSAVIYTVTCIYVHKKVSFKEVMHAIPKVWKRLVITLFCSMAIMFVYNFVMVYFVVIVLITCPVNQNNIGVYLIFGIIYLVGVCYMGVIWQLANTISVLEDIYGFEALMKSKILMKGKMGISIAIFLAIKLCVCGIISLFNSYVVFVPSNVGKFRRVGFGVMAFLLLCFIMLMGLVVHTIFYLVCKSYHHEQIDKSALANHLEVYRGEGYIVLKSMDIQKEQV